MTLLLVAIFILGALVRTSYIYPDNIILGFDQVRDLFDSLSIILDRDLRIVGPTAGNNSLLHHGVIFLYYILPPLIIFGGNPSAVSLYNAFFNLLGSLTLFFFAKSLFKSNKAGVLAYYLSSISLYYVEFSGWLSNPSVTLLTAPLALMFL